MELREHKFSEDKVKLQLDKWAEIFSRSGEWSMYVDIWRKWERGDVEKRMKHASSMENVGCSSNLNDIKG